MIRIITASILAVAITCAAGPCFARTVKVIMDDKKPNGKKWDGGWGTVSNPDPFIIVDGHSYKSSFCKDAFTCVFEISQTGPVSIEVWDKDLSAHDSAGKTVCTTGPIQNPLFLDNLHNTKCPPPGLEASCETSLDLCLN